MYTLITGASNGIGKEMAFICGEKKMNVLLISLPNENVSKISDEIRAKYGVKSDYFECNLTEVGVPKKILDWTVEKGYKINFLVNNAGFGGVGSFDSHATSYITSMLDLNVKATTLMTHHFLPQLKENAPSYLLNTSSMAANFPLPYKAMYAASKIYVKNFTLGLREEMKPFNVHVCLLQPGATPTNTVVKSQIEKGGTMAKISVLQAEDVARYAIDRTLAEKSKAIPGFKNRMSLATAKLIPSAIKMKMAVNSANAMLGKK